MTDNRSCIRPPITRSTEFRRPVFACCPCHQRLATSGDDIDQVIGRLVGHGKGLCVRFELMFGRFESDEVFGFNPFIRVGDLGGRPIVTLQGLLHALGRGGVSAGDHGASVLL